MLKAIIFDWGRTLWDNKNEDLFPETEEVLLYLKQKGYRMAVLSIGTPEFFDEKRNMIQESRIGGFFEKIVVSDKKEKEEVDEILNAWSLPCQEVIIVGDRTQREVKIAHKLGMQSVWIKKGAFAQELPDQETGEPTYTVYSLQELKKIL